MKLDAIIWEFVSIVQMTVILDALMEFVMILCAVPDVLNVTSKLENVKINQLVPLPVKLDVTIMEDVKTKHAVLDVLNVMSGLVFVKISQLAPLPAKLNAIGMENVKTKHVNLVALNVMHGPVNAKINQPSSAHINVKNVQTLGHVIDVLMATQMLDTDASENGDF